MSAYRSDRQRIETLLLPIMCQSVVKSGAGDPSAADAIACANHFGSAIEESIAGVGEKKKYSLLRRAMRLHETITEPYTKHGSRVDKVGLMVFYVLKWATESEYLILHDGTAMSKGLDLLLPALEHAAQIEPLENAARKQAKKLLAHLQLEGYFTDVHPIE